MRSHQPLTCRRFVKDNYHYKRTKIVLNPDHNKLGSFDDPLENPSNDPELKNGTRVLMNHLPIYYTWQDGKVVDKTGRVIMDSKTKKPAGSTSEPKSKSQTKKHPTALELLDKYAETQDKLGSSFISKLEVSTKHKPVAVP